MCGHGDAGLTGREIIVDSYGGWRAHGGRAFSGKDPTKVDRSAAYMARYLAKNIVAAGLAHRCTLQLAYAIGVKDPVAHYLHFHGTGKVSEDQVLNWIKTHIKLTPKAIREHLKLARPIYGKTATYGHFGRNPEANGSFSWESLDLKNRLIQDFA